MLTTRYVHGSPNWLDFCVPDVEAATAFYGTVFGWEFRSAGPGAGGYGFLELGGRVVAGIGPQTEEGAPSRWTVYFQADDADAAAQAVRQAGGTVLDGPVDVFTAGRSVDCVDPTGARFSLWQPGERKGLDVVVEAGTLAWPELYTTDAPAALDFYRAVLSWETLQTPLGQAGSYTIAAPAGRGPEDGHAGIMQLAQENLDHGSRSEWHPYFATPDCDATVATATQNGATVIIPPVDVEGVGRLAMLLDPFQAPFALLTAGRG